MKALGCATLHIWAGVLHKDHKSTPYEEYAAKATKGIYKRIQLPDGNWMQGKVAFAVLDGTGPLADALHQSSPHSNRVSLAIMRLLEVVTAEVVVSPSQSWLLSKMNPQQQTSPQRLSLCGATAGTCRF